MFHFFLKLSIIVFIFFINSNHLSANEKIMFIDTNYIFFNSVAGKNINDKLKDNLKKSQENLNTLKMKLAEDEKNLKNQQNIISKEEFNKRFILLKNEIEKFNNQSNKLNSQIDLLRKKYYSSFSKELSKIIQKYANENDIDLILNKNTILLGKNVLDLTKEVLKLFDENIKTLKID